MTAWTTSTRSDGLPEASTVVLTLAFAIALSPLFFSLYLMRHLRTRPTRHHTALILVLGDIGRSPRMMYHTESFAKHGWESAIVGYTDTPLIPSLLGIPHVHVFGLANPPKSWMKLPWIFRAPIRIIYQIISVLYICLVTIPVHPAVIMVQNPPSIPTLALAQLISYLCGSKLIIDWHNTGYSILAMRTGESSILVKIAKWFESYFGRQAYAHLFVTRALQSFLTEEWHLRGRSVVLHDRPPANFRRTDPIRKHELFSRLIPDFLPSLPANLLDDDPNATMFTSLDRPSHLPVVRPDRPALLVSSTSWTADEDFSLLLTALDMYQDALSGGAPLPKLLVIITGKGALRKPFEKAVAAREKSTWKYITVRCTFVSAKDYPTLLGCADLGISLHTSSSGRDLPMKVVDMFGCGVPVLAKGFECVGELVKEGQNGRTFDTGEELASLIIDILAGFPRSEKLDKLRSFFEPATTHSGASTPSRRRMISGTLDHDEIADEWTTWDQNWDRVIYHGLLT